MRKTGETERGAGPTLPWTTGQQEWQVLPKADWPLPHHKEAAPFSTQVGANEKAGSSMEVCLCFQDGSEGCGGALWRLAPPQTSP